MYFEIKLNLIVSHHSVREVHPGRKRGGAFAISRVGGAPGDQTLVRRAGLEVEDALFYPLGPDALL